jgi:hypothetical protein
LKASEPRRSTSTFSCDIARSVSRAVIPQPPECGRKDLSLAELADLIEQLPQIDWSPAIEAAARAERQPAAAFA